MSFILEALKKSEKKHEEMEVPNLHTVHGSARPVPGKRPMWPYLLVAGLLLNAGVLLWVLAPWTERPVVPAVVDPVLVPEAVPALAIAPLPEPLAAVPDGEPAPVPPATPVVEPPVVPAPAAAPAVAATPVPPMVEMPAAAAAMVEEAQEIIETEAFARPVESDWDGQRAIYEVADLPYDIQSRLPEIQVSVYAYSDDAGFRLVRVNNRILREGSYLDVGLLLDEITPTEMIFTFEGYRFRVPKQ
jgi:general secretion pathway protein B